MYIQHGKNLVEHHTHYKELHGFDKTVLMSRSEHVILHNKLRKTGKCNVAVKDLARISSNAKNRTHIGESNKYIKGYIKEYSKKYSKSNMKNKHLASFALEKNTQIQVRLDYNVKTKHIGISSTFRYSNR